MKKWYYITKPFSFGRFVFTDTAPEKDFDEKEVLGPQDSFSAAKRVALKNARKTVAEAQEITKKVRSARKTHYVSG